jgi:CheY-like chemotaxis protein
MPDIRVLVVDDDTGVRTLVATTLTLEGMAVYTARDGAEAWTAIQSRASSFFSVIVLDLQMPEMDGRAFGRLLREAQLDVPILLLSAHGAAAAQQEVGAAYAMSKPFDPAALAEEVRRLAGPPGQRA